jgi:hypothetical protein
MNHVGCQRLEAVTAACCTLAPARRPPGWTDGPQIDRFKASLQPPACILAQHINSSLIRPLAQPLGGAMRVQSVVQSLSAVSLGAGVPGLQCSTCGDL